MHADIAPHCPRPARRRLRPGCVTCASTWRKLLECTDRKVTDVAGDCGFGHLGRFSAYQQRRFGELPRETLSRAGR